MPDDPHQTQVPAPGRKRRPDLVGGAAAAVARTVKVVSTYSAFSKIAQVAPLMLGLLVVALSPSAWLSATLRRWVVYGMALGGAVGVLLLVLTARRPWRPSRLAGVASSVLIVALVAARFHLALSDVAFSQRHGLLQVVHDYFIGTGDLQETLYNVLAALLFAVAMAAATVALPALGFASVRRQRARAEAAHDRAGTDASKALLMAELTRVFESIDALRSENERLRVELASFRGGGGAPASGGDPDGGASGGSSIAMAPGEQGGAVEPDAPGASS